MFYSKNILNVNQIDTSYCERRMVWSHSNILTSSSLDSLERQTILFLSSIYLSTHRAIVRRVRSSGLPPDAASRNIIIPSSSFSLSLCEICLRFSLGLLIVRCTFLPQLQYSLLNRRYRISDTLITLFCPFSYFSLVFCWRLVSAHEKQSQKQIHVQTDLDNDR